jgi:hypothetical protein
VLLRNQRDMTHTCKEEQLLDELATDEVRIVHLYNDDDNDDDGE